jgi:hypothetical protein
MPICIATTATNEVHRKAAADAVAVQDAVNLIAVVGCFHRHLRALKDTGVGGDDLINHPIVLAFTSKLNSLCRMTTARELAALNAIERIDAGESVEYEVIPI